MWLIHFHFTLTFSLPSVSKESLYSNVVVFLFFFCHLETKQSQGGKGGDPGECGGLPQDGDDRVFLLLGEEEESFLPGVPGAGGQPESTVQTTGALQRGHAVVLDEGRRVHLQEDPAV